MCQPYMGCFASSRVLVFIFRFVNPSFFSFASPPLFLFFLPPVSLPYSRVFVFIASKQEVTQNSCCNAGQLATVVFSCCKSINRLETTKGFQGKICHRFKNISFINKMVLQTKWICKLFTRYDFPKCLSKRQGYFIKIIRKKLNEFCEHCSVQSTEYAFYHVSNAGKRLTAAARGRPGTKI